MEHKSWKPVDLKLDSDGEGTFRAVFATLEAWDSQGDWTERGAIGMQKVVISQWNHGSWDRGVQGLPIGVGEIHEDGNKAIVKGEFDLGDEDALRTYRKLKYLVEKDRNVEWSYALPDVQWTMGEREGRTGRIIQKVSVPEVSPVLLGAGVDTELVSIKSDDAKPMTPSDNETESHFMDRCMRHYMDGGRDQAQASAICHREWSGKAKEPPKNGASKSLIDLLDEACTQVKKAARGAVVARALREADGKGLSKTKRERLERLRAELRDADSLLGKLLAASPEPCDASEELRKIEAAHEERKRVCH